MANVSMDAIQQARNICLSVISELNSSSEKLKRRHQGVKGAWGDDKHKQLGVIIDGCSQAMRSPINELFDCIGKLDELEKAITEYGSTNL